MKNARQHFSLFSVLLAKIRLLTGLQSNLQKCAVMPFLTLEARKPPQIELESIRSRPECIKFFCRYLSIFTSHSCLKKVL